MNLYVSKKIREDIEMSDWEIAIYCVLQSYMRNKDFSTYYISKELLHFLLFGTLNVSKKTNEKVSSGIKKLIEKKYISVIEKSKIGFVVNKIDVDFKKESYSMIRYDDMNTIIKSDYKYKMKLLRHYINLIGTIDTIAKVELDGKVMSSVVGHYSIDAISNYMQCTRQVVLNNIRKLEELKLIYVYRSQYYTYNTNGKLISPVNVYGRYKDKDYIVAYGEQEEEIMCGHIQRDIKRGNAGRSLRQKFNWLVRGREYSPEEIQEIYDYIKSKNEKNAEAYRKYNNEDSKHKIEDMSIFDQYDFIVR